MVILRVRAGPAKRVGSVFNRGCTAQFMIVFHKNLTTCSTDIYDHDSYGSFLFLCFFGRVMPDEGLSMFGLFVKKCEEERKRKKITGIIFICALRTTCRNFIKNTCDLRCVFANRCTHQFRSNLPKISSDILFLLKTEYRPHPTNRHSKAIVFAERDTIMK